MSVMNLLKDLTGQQIPIQRDTCDIERKFELQLSESGVGCSQLNEILLYVGYDRISSHFFQYLLDGKTKYQEGSAFKNLNQFREGIDRYRVQAILRYGNIKYGFKHLSRMNDSELNDFLTSSEPENFSQRHEHLISMQSILARDTYYLGYLIEAEIEQKLKNNPDDEDALKQKKQRELVIKKGKENHEAYLTSDHMDVYVATSMRYPHEYRFVNKIIKELVDDDKLKPLKLRWFNPTQAYCKERIDKGLAEALMLKRAACTLYLAQENDTFGKDSELASTLAQGKPVIAYVPEILPGHEETFADQLLKDINSDTPNRDEAELMLDQLQIFQPEAAWTNQVVQSWLRDRSTINKVKLKQVLAKAIKTHYDRRANTLKETHPLGIQVNLMTGVANGVLVVRHTSQCADLILRILTHKLEFKIEHKTIEEKEYLFLREKLSNSVFRVVTGDILLTNSFWNYYIS